MSQNQNTLTTTLIPESCCTKCKKAMDAASSTEPGVKPKPDDATMCIYCGHIMVFDERLMLRDPTLSEQMEMFGDPRIAFMRSAWHKMREAKTKTEPKPKRKVKTKTKTKTKTKNQNG